jgi:hypothetical protein
MLSPSFSAGDPLSLTIAADARLTSPDYCDDQVWELYLNGGEPPSLSLETTYGLRAQRVRVFPRFLLNDKQRSDPASFYSPPKVVCLYPNYLAVTFYPFEELEVLAEYWIPESQVAAGRLRLTNRSILPLNFRLELAALLAPRDKQGSLTAVNLGSAQALAGETANLQLVLFMNGGPQAAASPYPALTLDFNMYPGNVRICTWAAAGMREQQASLEAAQRVTARSWDAETARIELLQHSQAVQIETGNPEWDAVLAMAQKNAFELLLSSPANLPHTSFVLTRRPDQGFSLRGDGADHPLPWAGQTALDAYYLASLLPGAPHLGAGLLRNFLAVQDEEGRIDWRPGLGGQRTRRLAQPVLASLALRLAQALETAGEPPVLLNSASGEPAADAGTAEESPTYAAHNAQPDESSQERVEIDNPADETGSNALITGMHPVTPGEVVQAAQPDSTALVDPADAPLAAGGTALASGNAALAAGNALTVDTALAASSTGSDLLREVYPGLLRFFQAWFRPEHDADGDGIPEWENALQTGLDDSPIFDRFAPEPRGTDASRVESPGLMAMLYSECASLIEMAQALGPAAAGDLNELHAVQARLRQALDACWDSAAGLYHYRDYASHLSLPGLSMVSFQGSGVFGAKRHFKRPRRLVIRLDVHEERTYAATFTLTGVTPEGEVTESLDTRSFAWLSGQAYAVTQQTYLAITQVEVLGLGPRDRGRVFAPDLTQEDCSLLLPLWAGACSPERARQMVESALLARFRRPFGISLAPGVSERVPQASVSMLWNHLLGEGLLRYGYRAEAGALVESLLTAAAGALKQKNAFHQSYHAESGQPAGERGHLHGILPLGLFLQVLGIKQLGTSQVLLDGFSPFPNPITVQYRRVKLICHRDRTEVSFAGGAPVTVDRPGPHRLIR